MLKSIIITICIFGSLNSVAQDKDLAIYGKWKLEATNLDSLMRKFMEHTVTTTESVTVVADTISVDTSYTTYPALDALENQIATDTVYMPPDTIQAVVEEIREPHISYQSTSDSAMLSRTDSFIEEFIQSIKHVEFTFKPDGIFEVFFPKQPVKTGKYSVNVNNATITMSGTSEGEKDTVADFRFINGNLKLVMTDPAQPMVKVWILFKKVQ